MNDLKRWPPRVAEAPVVHSANYRKCDRPLHTPVQAKIGQKSAACAKGKHRLACYMLSCGCECHAEEREATGTIAPAS